MIVRYPACQTSGRVWFDTIRLTSVSNVDFATKLCSPITAAVRPFHARAAVVPDMISWTGGQSRKQSFTCAGNSLGFIAAIAAPIIQQLVELPQRRMALSHCFYWRPQGDSNPRTYRERVVSWASRRWGRGLARTRPIVWPLVRVVEVSGIEPLTSCMPCKRSPS